MKRQNLQLTRMLQEFYSHPVAQVSLELFFSIIAIIFFALFAIRPTLVTMSDLVKEIQDKEDLNRRLTQKIAALSSVQAIYQSEKDRLKILDQAIPPTPQFSNALLMIEKLASEQGLVIQSVEAKQVPKPPTTPAPFAQQTRIKSPVSVTVMGDYLSIRNFVEALRTVQRQFIVESIAFIVRDDRGEKKLQATVTIDLEYFGLDPNAAKTATASATIASPVPTTNPK